MNFQFVFLILALAVSPLFAQNEKNGKDDKNRKREEIPYVGRTYIKDSVYMLSHNDTNALVFLGREYSIMIDGHNEAVAPQTLIQAGKLSLNPVRFLVNTHHHKDHTGGNAYYSDSGVTILCNSITHNNMLTDLNAEEIEKISELKKKYLSKLNDKKELNPDIQSKIQKLQNEEYERDINYPVFLFEDNFKINLANESIEMRIISNAHTSADLIVRLKNNNVVACGDLFFNGKYPFIDEKMGGNIDNFINAINALTRICNNDTVIVPGHGPVASKSDLESYKRMLEFTQKGVQMDYLLGKTLEEVIANKSITANFDAQGYGTGYVKTEDYISMLYRAAEKRYPRRN